MSWELSLTQVVAIYAAALSTYSFVVGRRDKARLVKVKLSMGFLAPNPQLEHLLLVEAANPGERPATVNTPVLFMPDQKQVAVNWAGASVTFPHELRGGDSCKVWVGASALAGFLRGSGYAAKQRLVGVYRDGLGKRYKSKPLRFDLDQWPDAAPPLNGDSTEPQE